MNLEEIKAARLAGKIAYSRELEWLIAVVDHHRIEIDCLKKLMEDWKMIDCNQAAALTNVAVRCAEIALEVANTQQGKSGYAEGWKDCGDQIAIQIERWFSL